jgi:hypothetical protein
MQTRTDITLTAVEIQDELRMLYVERALADIEGLSGDESYMADLVDDIESHKVAFVGAVVTEIAALRASLDGALRG